MCGCFNFWSKFQVPFKSAVPSRNDWICLRWWSTCHGGFCMMGNKMVTYRGGLWDGERDRDLPRSRLRERLMAESEVYSDIMMGGVIPFRLSSCTARSLKAGRWGSDSNTTTLSAPLCAHVCKFVKAGRQGTVNTVVFFSVFFRSCAHVQVCQSWKTGHCQYSSVF